MSRRRKLPRLPDSYRRAYLVAVVCTGRRSHPEAVIAKLGQFADVDGTIRVLYQKASHPDPLTGWQKPDGDRTFCFRCCRCPSDRGKPRDVRLHEDRVLEAMEALRALGVPVPVIDVSTVC